MATENGIENLSYARRNIEILRSRMEYLEGWIEEHDRATGVPDTGVRFQEARAIRWALPALEAEWDQLRRIHEFV